MRAVKFLLRCGTFPQTSGTSVPGLFQTEEYARQVHVGYQRVMPIPPGTIERPA